MVIWYNTRMTIDTQIFKENLLKEQAVLEKELNSLGIRNPKNPSDWDAVIPPNGTDEADEGDVADSMERFENYNSETDQLEKQLKDVKDALEKIESGTFGICEVGGEEIEQDRLEANPSARTCKIHMS